MSSEADFVSRRCGLISPTQDRLECSSCQGEATACARNILAVCATPVARKIRTHSSHRYLWLRLRYSTQKGRSMSSTVRDLFSDSPMWPWKSLSFPELGGLAVNDQVPSADDRRRHATRHSCHSYLKGVKWNLIIWRCSGHPSGQVFSSEEWCFSFLLSFSLSF